MAARAASQHVLWQRVLAQRGARRRRRRRGLQQRAAQRCRLCVHAKHLGLSAVECLAHSRDVGAVGLCRGGGGQAGT